MSWSCCSVTQSSLTVCNPMDCSISGLLVHHSSGVCSNLCPLSQWCHPTISSSVAPFSSCPQSFPALGIFQGVGSLHQVAKVLEFQLQHLSFQRIFRVVSSGIDWFDLLIVQGTLKSLLQHCSSKASILQCSAFFMVELSHPYMTTGKKNIALTIWTFVGKVMSLLFNALSRLVIAFLSKSKHLLISWVQSPPTVMLEPKKIKFATVSNVSPSLPWSDGTRCHDLNFLNVEF